MEGISMDRFARTAVAVLVAALVDATLASADETCQSPYLPKI